jgi:hypothetical protein
MTTLDRPCGRHETRQSSVAWVLPGDASLARRQHRPGVDDYNLSQIVGYASPPKACAFSLSRNPLVIEAGLETLRSSDLAVARTLRLSKPTPSRHRF